jgi:hypothetical protein
MFWNKVSVPSSRVKARQCHRRTKTSTACLFKMVLYTDYTPILKTSCQPTLLVSYLEIYLNSFEHQLLGWKFARNILKSMAVPFIKIARHIHRSCSVQLFRERF